MPFDLSLAEKIRLAAEDLALGPSDMLTECKMFGGLCFLLNGNILAGVRREEMLIRLSDDDMEDALMEPHVTPMHHNQRIMKNFAFVDSTGLKEDVEIAVWLQKSFKYVRKRQLDEYAKSRRPR